MVQDTPSRKLDQYIVRFPDGMRDTLKERAAINNRSLNAEIVDRLDNSLSAETELVREYQSALDGIMQWMAKIAERLDALENKER